MKKLTLSVLTFVLLTLSVFLFACSGIIDINVNFIVDDAVYATVGTNGSEAIKMPENPTKEGYTFDGWYWDNDVWEKPFTANSILEMPLSSDMSDMKVYAKWEQENSTPLPEGTDISTTLLTVDGDIASISLSNSTQIFSFINDITVAKDASFIVARDIGCEQIINSKIATLNEGDNSFYILVTNGNEQKLYTVTVRRRPMYTVTFNTAGGSSVPSQTIEEGGILTAPQETTRAGYTFNGWNTDLTAPITENKTVTAQWTAHTNITYKVEYYKENVDKNGYDLVDTQNLTGTTYKRANAEQKTFEHFTLNTSKSTLSGNINGNGSLVLKVYYTRNTYKVTTTRNNSKGGTITSGGTYPYDKEITLTATTKSGYTFLGWFVNGEKVCSTENYTFNVDKTETYEARWEANAKTPYKVEYYKENVDRNGYDLVDTQNLTGTTDTTATAEQKTFEHFALNTSKSTLSGNINGNGSLVLKVYYSINTFTVSQTIGGTVTGCGTYTYDKQVTVTATTNLGYTFLGWFSDNTCVSNATTATFSDKDIIAKFAVLPEMAIFNFTSTPTTCTIIGIKDKTVTNIVVPSIVTSINGEAFRECQSLVNITLPFVGANKDGTESTRFGYIFGRLANSIDVPKTLRTVVITGGSAIPAYAFARCSNLTSVTLPSSIESIGENAFENCVSLVNINIHDNIKSIGDWAFNACKSLKNVIIGNGVTDIGDHAFANCKNVETVTIGNSVRNIGSAAFDNCESLTSVIIGSSVESIGIVAFFECHSISTVMYRGTEVQWEAISQDGAWDTLYSDFTLIFNYKGE